MSTLLEVRNLTTSYKTSAGPIKAVDNISFTIAKGETVAIVGESGSGKSNAMLSVMRLIQPPGAITGGQILFDNCDLGTLSNRALGELRGNRLSMVFQDAMTALNPLLTVGKQITEILEQHLGFDRIAARSRATELLYMVGIPDPARLLQVYPHQLSGGMRQRVMIAMALSCEPDLLIADEPTTALDVTIQAQIVKLVKDLQQKMGMAVVWITHDLGVVASLADRVMVMYAGQIVESAPVAQLYRQPAHPYTAALLASLPRFDATGNGKLLAIDGTPPDALNPPKGCPFADRCTHVIDKCWEMNRPLVEIAPGHSSACWLVENEQIPDWNAAEEKQHD
jgi:oligopeptide transport system ATP-binding protein